jgi:hypothetical protein
MRATIVEGDGKSATLAAEGGSGTPVTDISIEVNDLDQVERRRLSQTLHASAID